MQTEHLNDFVEQGSEVVVYIDISGSAASVDSLTQQALDRLGAFLDSKQCPIIVRFYDHEVRDVCSIGAGSVQRGLTSLDLPHGGGTSIKAVLDDHRTGDLAIVVGDRYFFESDKPEKLGGDSLFFYDVEKPPELPSRTPLLDLLASIGSLLVFDKYAFTGMVGMIIFALGFLFIFDDEIAAVTFGLMAVLFVVLPPLVGERRNKKAA